MKHSTLYPQPCVCVYVSYPRTSSLLTEAFPHVCMCTCLCVCVCVCIILYSPSYPRTKASPMCAYVYMCVCMCLYVYVYHTLQPILSADGGLTSSVYMCLCVYIIIYRDSTRNLSPRTEASSIGAVLPTKMRGRAGAALHLRSEGDASVRLGSPGERGGKPGERGKEGGGRERREGGREGGAPPMTRSSSGIFQTAGARGRSAS